MEPGLKSPQSPRFQQPRSPTSRSLKLSSWVSNTTPTRHLLLAIRSGVRGCEDHGGRLASVPSGIARGVRRRSVDAAAATTTGPAAPPMMRFRVFRGLTGLGTRVYLVPDNRMGSHNRGRMHI
jgi:hypothetical protein